MNKSKLIQSLQKINVIQYGSFTLKSGLISPYYFDLRKLYSHPQLLSDIVRQIGMLVMDANSSIDLVCGVPLAGIPLATTFSILFNKPMILLRKDRKDHGTKNLIEGIYKAGDRVLLIEDVTTTGSSILEARLALEAEDLIVQTIATVIDRRASAGGLVIKSLLTGNDILDASIGIPQKMWDRKFGNNFAKRLWDIMLAKNTNLCYSMDVADLDFVEEIADYICLLKVHLDIYHSSSHRDLQNLEAISTRKNFLILDDRKYADIGSIVAHQVSSNHIFGIKSCTAHSIFGQSTLDGLRSVEGCFLIAQSSAQNNFITPDYTTRTHQLAESNQKLVSGFITQSRIGGEAFLYLTPGVHLTETADDLGQGYRSVEDAVKRDGCDVIIVGRGIYKAQDRAVAAKQYRDLGWKYLIQRNS